MCVWVAVFVKTLKPRKMYKLHLLPQYCWLIIWHLSNTFQDIQLWKVPIQIHCNQLNKLSSHTGWKWSVNTIELVHTHTIIISILLLLLLLLLWLLVLILLHYNISFPDFWFHWFILFSCLTFCLSIYSCIVISITIIYSLVYFADLFGLNVAGSSIQILFCIFNISLSYLPLILLLHLPSISFTQTNHPPTNPPTHTYTHVLQ